MARTVNEALREKKRQLIIDAASTLFSTRGYFATTISEIAKKAGISHAAVFTYFSSKEELLEAIILGPLKEESLRLCKDLDQMGSPGRTLESIVKNQIESLIQKGSYLRVVQIVLSQPAVFEKQAQIIFDLSEEIVSGLARLIEQGQKAGELSEGDPRATGWSYFAYVNGLGMVNHNPGTEIVREFIDRGCRIIGIVR
ncbi:HTH-type transcriptional regulator TtgR [compost metagenome]